MLPRTRKPMSRRPVGHFESFGESVVLLGRRHLEGAALVHTGVSAPRRSANTFNAAPNNSGLSAWRHSDAVRTPVRSGAGLALAQRRSARFRAALRRLASRNVAQRRSEHPRRPRRRRRLGNVVPSCLRRQRHLRDVRYLRRLCHLRHLRHPRRLGHPGNLRHPGQLRQCASASCGLLASSCNVARRRAVSAIFVGRRSAPLSVALRSASHSVAQRRFATPRLDQHGRGCAHRPPACNQATGVGNARACKRNVVPPGSEIRGRRWP